MYIVEEGIKFFPLSLSYCFVITCLTELEAGYVS